MIDVTAYIHPKAHVEGAAIGARTKVWQFASVIRGSIIGNDVSIASGSVIDAARIGNESIVSNNCSIYPGSFVGNNVFIGPNVTLCNDLYPVADKTGFDIAKFSDGKWSTIIEDGASIGANAVILPGIRIGKGAMVAAGAVVTKNLEAGYVFNRNGTYKPVRSRERMQFCTSM